MVFQRTACFCSPRQPGRDVLEQFGRDCEWTAPEIEAVPAVGPRPRWSVMIPTYEGAELLRATLQSVLAQDRGPEWMQIEVVDDCSTRDDPEAVVRAISGRRVTFFRNPRNLGAVPNFNTCIRRARGEWVHILHGDDLVGPDFYQAMEDCMQRHPRAALLASRCRVIDRQGNGGALTARVEALESFTTDPSPFFLDNHLRTPAVVVRRRFYQQHGGFLEGLVHTADWEMWCRVIARQGGVMMDRALACYREFAGTDTSRLMRTAENLRDTARLGAVLARTYPEFDLSAFLQMLRLTAWNQLHRFQDLGDWEAVRANKEVCRLLRVTDLSAFLRAKQYLKSIPLVRRLAAARESCRKSSRPYASDKAFH